MDKITLTKCGKYCEQVIPFLGLYPKKLYICVYGDTEMFSCLVYQQQRNKTLEKQPKYPSTRN